ncbi:MAG: hypothetical protein Q4A83_02525 [Bacillota bacterium]|nr:hypothetical protein [Bacillota bacterium]
MIFLGIGAFLLFALGDANDAYLKSKWLKLCFPLGFCALAAATYFRLNASAGVSNLWCAAGFVFLLLELYALFGAFPAGETYVETDSKRMACCTGVYALCRHPGVLFFAGMYVCMSLGLNLPWLDTAAYCALDVLLVTFEDKCTFPHILGGYEEYKKATPFLIPDIKSLKRMFTK